MPAAAAAATAATAVTAAAEGGGEKADVTKEKVERKTIDKVEKKKATAKIPKEGLSILFFVQII